MKYKKVVLCSSFFIIVLLILGIVLFFPRFKLENNNVLVGQAYIPKVKVYNTFDDLSDKVKINNTVDVNKIGEYEIKCSVKYLFFNVKKKFIIRVIDKEPPVISIAGNDTVTVCPGKEYVEEGYSAIDNHDGDITSNVIIERNPDNIIYKVLDSSNNVSRKERKIIYEDKENPSLTLYGNSTVSVYLGNRYYEPGYVALDNCDGDISGNVKVTGYVDTSKIGTYTLNYEIIDSSNNKVIVQRTVVVSMKPNYYGNGKIYLTFDDGSSYLTNQILDILKEENVKATFFVVYANQITKRVYDEGHSIALHSNTHNYGYIYSSIDNYFNDLNAISNNVYNITGFRSKIIRFPGGSSNTVSRNYNVGIMTRLTSEVLNRGYTYFDWNIDSNDAGSDIYNSENIYYNVVNNLSHNKTNVVLMHDSYGHEATVNALRNIIQYGKTYGYTFDVITENTPVVAHGVNN